MDSQARRRAIQALVTASGVVRVVDLAIEHEVSKVTIRHDLEILERRGVIVRVHGGAIPNTAALARHEPATPTAKRSARWVGARAAALVADGETIVVDSSPAVHAMLPHLASRRAVTVLTNGLETAMIAASMPTVTVRLLGGDVAPRTAATAGSPPMSQLRQQRIDRAFVSCSGLSPDGAFTDQDGGQAAMKRAMAEAADALVVLAQGTDLGPTQGRAFAQVAQAREVIVEPGIPVSVMERLRGLGAVVSVAGERMCRLIASSADAGARVRVGFATVTGTFGFGTSVQRSIESAAIQAGTVDLSIADNAEDDEVATRNVQRFIRDRMDVVIEWQAHAAHGAVIGELLSKAGIPLLAVDVPIRGAPLFGADNYRAGWLAGSYLGREVVSRPHGTVGRVVCLQLGASGALVRERTRGQLDGLSSRLDLGSVAVRTYDVGYSAVSARDAVAADLAAWRPGRLTLILACHDDAALGAIEAVEDARRSADVLMVSHGADGAALAELQRSGTPLVAAVTGTSERYGQQLLSLAMDLVAGRVVPPMTVVSHEIVTAQGARLYGQRPL